jgi:hypothetical protein
METVIVGYDAEVQKDIKASKLIGSSTGDGPLGTCGGSASIRSTTPPPRCPGRAEALGDCALHCGLPDHSE